MHTNYRLSSPGPDWSVLPDAVQREWQKLDTALSRIATEAAPLRILSFCERPEVVFAMTALAWQRGDWLFLADPHWPETMQRERFQQCLPHAVLDSSGALQAGPVPSANPIWEDSPWSGQRPLFFLPTGGSSGWPRWVVHSADTLESSAKAWRDVTPPSLTAVAATLPPFHVSGFMPFCRAILNGCPLRLMEDGWLLPGTSECLHGVQVSMVPTQLIRFLRRGGSKRTLSACTEILLGGGAITKDLVGLIRQEGLPVAPVYGMTETAAMVTKLTPGRFLTGENGVGKPLPHGKVRIRSGKSKPTVPEEGRVEIRCKSLGLGYWPFQNWPLSEDGWFQTSDAGWLDESGSLHISQRLDRVIVTGGKKVDAFIVEQEILALDGILDAHVWGQPDSEWGQRVVAALVSSGNRPDLPDWKQQLRLRLAPWQLPKEFFCLAEIPRSAAGKIDQPRLENLCSYG